MSRLRCPSCGEWSPAEEWGEREVYCEDCGTHPALECPLCEERVDTVYRDPESDDPDD